MWRQLRMKPPPQPDGAGTSSDPFRSPDPPTSSTMQLMSRPVVRNPFHRTTLIESLSSMEAATIYLWYMEQPQADTAAHRVFNENYDAIIPEIAKRGNIAFDHRVADVLFNHIIHHNALVAHAMADFPPRFHQPWMNTINCSRLEILLLELATAAESKKLDEQGANLTSLPNWYIQRIRGLRHAACEKLTFMFMSRLILYQAALNPSQRRGDYLVVFEIISQRNHRWVVEVLENKSHPYFFDNDQGKLKGTMNFFGERYV